MAEAIGRFKPGENLPVFCEELVPAGRLVVIGAAATAQGDYSVKLAPEKSEPAVVLGASQRDSGPTTDPATSWTRRIEVQTGGVVRVKAAAGITAGKAVYCSGSGEVKEGVTAEKPAVGVAMKTVSSGELVEVNLI